MNTLKPGTRVRHTLTGRYGTIQADALHQPQHDRYAVQFDGISRPRMCSASNLSVIDEPVFAQEAATSLILVGIEEDSTSYEFRALRGFLNDEEGIKAARQYVNLLIEAKPYDISPLVKVVGFGLTGNPADELTRDRGVKIGDLFPIEPAPIPGEWQPATEAQEERIASED